MKCKMKHKKLWVSIISVVALTALVTGILTINKEIVFATDSPLNSLLRPFELPSKSEGDTEVRVRYVFDNDEVYQEKTVKANKGKRILEKDLPVLPRDMVFTDEFKDYLVKGDGHDEVVRKVKKNLQDQSAESDETVVEEQKESNNLQQETQELKELIANLNKELKDKAEVNDQQKDIIKDLEAKIKELQSKMNSNQVAKANETLKQDIEALKKQVQSLQDKSDVKNEDSVQERSATETTTNSTNTQAQGLLPKTSEVVTTDELSTNTESPTSNSEATQEKKTEIRQPNQAISQASTNSSSQGSSLGESEKPVNTNKGIPSAPSKARGKVTENKDNGNKEYPIHHGDDTDKQEKDKLAADARQFVTFTTKTGKTFHLIINHDKENDNVMLLTEVSEDDLLNMVEKKTAPKQEVVKESPKKEEPLPVKKEEESSTGTYFIVVLVVVAALGAGYYFKVVKNKENKELEDMEEEDDDFFSESEETEVESELVQDDEEI